jgi:hypothetical protein
MNNWQLILYTKFAANASMTSHTCLMCHLFTCTAGTPKPSTLVHTHLNRREGQGAAEATGCTTAAHHTSSVLLFLFGIEANLLLAGHKPQTTTAVFIESAQPNNLPLQKQVMSV